jgi:hypothetical protein
MNWDGRAGLNYRRAAAELTSRCRDERDVESESRANRQ